MRLLQPCVRPRSVRTALYCWAVVVALSLASCGGPALSLAPSSGQSRYDYKEVWAVWTTDDRVYKDFEGIASTQGTFISPSFLEAWFQEYQKVFKPLPADFAAKQSEWHNLLENQECVILALTTQKREWNDLASGASIWKVYLSNDRGGRVGSSLVTPIKTKDVTYRHFFPQLETFYDGYIVCFPRYEFTANGKTPVLGEKTRSFEVELRSTVGKLLLRWDLNK